jgi:hypothetical protein
MNHLMKFYESSLSNDRIKSQHKENIRNIVDESNSLHKKVVNGIVSFIKSNGEKSIKIPYQWIRLYKRR